MQMEQTPPIGRDDRFDGWKRLELSIRHGDRNLWDLNREKPPESTTLLIHVPRHDVRSGGGEKL
jgi:hypothetical protein